MRTLLTIQFVFGLGIIASPWVFGYYEVTGARWVNVVCGLVICATSLFGILGHDDAHPGNSATNNL